METFPFKMLALQECQKSQSDCSTSSLQHTFPPFTKWLALRLRGHLQTEICTLNIIVMLRGLGGYVGSCARDAKH